jgi:hypothetical protein
MDVLQDRTLEQRHAALARANRIRTYRACKKKDVKAGREPWDFFLMAGQRGDPMMGTMRLREALICMPALGPKKADAIMRMAGISSSRTLGGMTGAQWGRLYAALGSYPSIRRRLSATGGSIPA